MKLENEHVLGVQTPPRKSYNPFDSDDDETNAKGNLNGCAIKSFEVTPDSLTFHLDSSNLSWEEAILRHSRNLSDSIPADTSSEEVLYRKDADLFTDKTITEGELPGLFFSYKDNGLHSVKDIGIDEGVPAHDKVWIKSLDDHDSKNLSSVLAFDVDVDDDVLFTNDVKKNPFAQDLAEDLVKESALVHEELERLYSADMCGTHDLLRKDKFEHDSSKKEKESNFNWQNTGGLVESGGIVDGEQNPLEGEKDEVTCEKVEMTENKVSGEEHDKSREHLDPSGMDEVEVTTESNVALHAGKSVTLPSLTQSEATLDSIEALHEGKSLEQPSLMHEAEGTTESIEAHNAEESLAQPSIMHELAITMKSNESQTEEASSVQPVELTALLEPAGRGALSYNSKVESGSIILDFKAAASISVKEEEILQKNEAVEKPPVAQIMSRDEGGPDPDSSILDCETDKRVHGETSFSATMPPPASITYMGPNAHNGNISLRSESSAGSTRSFAFPVLQAEWNSSPVRMAKADQRRFHKQRGWVHSLMCCKF